MKASVTPLNLLINNRHKLSDIHMANISQLDLNLLRLFDAVYRTRSISKAAQQLGLSQPATSQALTRLRVALGDPLFERTSMGVRPTERADRLARSVQAGLAVLEAGLEESADFDPLTSTANIRLHLTDIGEARFLPRLMEALRQRAPRVQLTAQAWPQDTLSESLDNGQLHFAIGFLPNVTETAQQELIADRYLLLLRAGHPFARLAQSEHVSPERLRELDYVVVRSHAATARILQLWGLEHRVRLVTSSFLALPAIVRSTDLAVLMPREIALGFQPPDQYLLVEPGLPLKDFTVSLHWSRRFEQRPMQRWFRHLVLELFAQDPAALTPFGATSASSAAYASPRSRRKTSSRKTDPAA